MKENPLELWDASAAAWIARVNDGDTTRPLLLDPVMLERAGDVSGLKVLDVGCGEGRFCRMLASRGAEVTGIDPTVALLEQARALDPEGRYLLSGGESLPFEDGSFDLTICYLVLIDIPDYRAAISEMARVTRSGGRILIANINPAFTATDDLWKVDEETGAVNLPVVDYFQERGTRVSWANIDIVNYHRSYRDYFAAFLSHPLRLTFFDEPRPSEEILNQYPSMIVNWRVPYFNVLEWSKD